jgi:TonB family protein
LHTSKPPYPYQARAARLQGSGSVRVVFDGSGHVSSAVIEQSVGSGILDSNTISYAKANWTGPPNTTTTVPITYRLQ